MKPRGTCVVCKSNLSLRADGTIRDHGYVKGMGEDALAGSTCAGSGALPVEADPLTPIWTEECTLTNCNEPTVAIVHAPITNRRISLCRRHTIQQLASDARKASA